MPGPYLSLRELQLGQRLVEVRMFGSAARGEIWPASSPMHSDVDLLMVTRAAVSEAEEEELGNETNPLFLECGRQLSAHFYSERQLAEPETGHVRELVANIAADVVWYGRSATNARLRSVPG